MTKVLHSCLLFLFIGSTLSGLSQQKSQSVIASAGDISKGANVILEWTLGEPAIESVSTLSSLYTQGFHQPVLDVQRANSGNTLIKNVFRVFPNPATSVLNIQLDKPVKERLLITLINVSGRALQNITFPQEATASRMDVSRHPHGIYLLRITNQDGSIHSEFKIIKAK